MGDNADEIPDKPQEIEAAALEAEAEAELTAEGTTTTTAEAGPPTEEAGAAGDENASDIKEIAVEEDEDENSDDENLICTCPCCCCLCSCIKSITRIHSAQGGLEAGGIFVNFGFRVERDSKGSGRGVFLNKVGF